MNWQSFGRANSKSQATRDRALQLLIEVLEDRQVPALLLAAGSETLPDDPTLLKYPGLKTPYSGDKLLVQVDNNQGLTYFKSLIQSQAAADLRNAFDFNNSAVLFQTSSNSMLRINLKPNVDPVGVAGAVDILPHVQFASVNFVYRKQEGYGLANFTPNDPFASLQYQSQNTEAVRAWEYIRGTGTVNNLDYHPVVCVTDSGTDIDHVDLKNSIWTNPGEIPGNGIDDDNNGYIDDVHGVDIQLPFSGPGPKPAGDVRPDSQADGHGTHVAGIIAAQIDNSIGVTGIAGGGRILPDGSTAPTAGAQIMSVKLTNATNYDSQLIVEALNYAYVNNADITNSSIILMNGQAPIQAAGFTLSDDSAVIGAFKNLHDKGVISFVAAANDDLNVSDALARNPYVVWVSATSKYDTKSSFSNYGTSVDIAAPGGDFYDQQGNYDPTGGIYSTLPGNLYDYECGTSMASPVAAGVAALIKSAHPDWTSQQIVSQIYATADNIYNIPGNAAYQGQLGHGRINAFGGSTSSTGFVAVASGVSIRAAADIDGTVKVWSATGKLEEVLSVTPGKALTSIALDGDTRMAVGSSDGTISYFTRPAANSATWFRLVSKATVDSNSKIVGLQMGTNQGPTNDLTGIVYALSEKGTLVRQDFVNNISTKIAVGSATGLAFNSNQSLLAVGSAAGGFLTVAQNLAGVPARYTGTPGVVGALQFSTTSPSTLVIADNSGAVTVWNLSASPASMKLLVPGDGNPITGFDLSATNIAYGHADGTVHIRALSNGAFINQYSVSADGGKGGAGALTSVSFGGNGTEILIANQERQVYRFTVKGGTSQTLPSGVIANAVAARGAGNFGANGNTRAIAGSDGKLYLGTATQINLAGIAVSANPLTQIKWSPNGLFVAVVDSAGAVFVVDSQQGTSTQLADPALTSPVVAIAISADSLSIATATDDGALQEWTYSTGKISFVFPKSATYPVANPLGVGDLTYTTNGKFLVSADKSGYSRVWNRDPLDPANKTSTGARQASYVRYIGSSSEYGLTKAQASPNGQLVALGNEAGQVEIWDIVSFRLLSRTPYGGGSVVGISFTSDSQNFVSATSGGQIRYYSSNSGSQISSVRDYNAGLISVSVDPTQSTATNLGILVGLPDGTVEQIRTAALPVSQSLPGQGALPTVKFVANLPGMGATYNTVPKDIQVEFSGLLDTVRFKNDRPVQFRGRGADGIFGTTDDNILPLVPTSDYAIGSNSLTFRVEGVMMPDTYRFEVDANKAVNPFGTKLDGNNDGIPGDDYKGPVFSFTGEKGAAYGRVLDQNGIGIADRRVYADLNGNGKFDSTFIPQGESTPTKFVPATLVPAAIDDSKPTVAVLDVTSENGRQGTITNLSLKMTLRHSRMSDLTGFLQGPDGSKILLFSGLSSFSNYGVTVQGLQDITFSNNPSLPTLDRLVGSSTKQIVTGNVRPSGDLSQFSGLSTFGQWKFIVVDSRVIANGYVQSWSLTFTTSEPSSVRNSVNSSNGTVQYLTTTDAAGNYEIPGLGSGLGTATSLQTLLKVDNSSTDQKSFADFQMILPSDGQRNITVSQNTALIGNDFIQKLISPTAVLTYNGAPVTALTVNNLGAAFSLSALLQPASALRGPTFGTASDSVTLYAQSTLDKNAPLTPLATIDCVNGKLAQTFANPFAGMTTSLVDGTYNIFVTQTALGSHESLPVALGTITLDTTAPLAPIIKTVTPFNPFTLSVPSTTPTFTGTGEPGALIQILSVSGSTVFGSGLVNQDGNWSITLSKPIVEGPNTLVAYATDPYSNKSPASTPFALTVVSVGPKAPIITQIDGSALPAGIYFTQSTSINLKATLDTTGPVRIYLNNVLFQTTSVVGPGPVILPINGLPTTAINVPLVLSLVQVDGYDLPSPTSGAVSLVVNSDVPSLPAVSKIVQDTGRSSSDGITRFASPVIWGTAQPYSSVQITLDGGNLGTVIADSAGYWSQQTNNLFEGNHEILLGSVSATGVTGPNSGIPGAPAYTIVLDLTNPNAPTVTGTKSPDAGIVSSNPNFTNSKTPYIQGSAEPNSLVEILLNGVVIGSGLADNLGQFSVRISTPASEGLNSVTVRAVDVAGNVGAVTPYSFTVQTVGYPFGAVTVGGIRIDTGYSNSDGITSVSPTEVFGVAPTGAQILLIADAGSSAEKVLGTATAVANEWKWTGLSNLGEGKHTLRAIGTDPFGNPTPSQDYRILIDQTAPANTVINSLSSKTGRNELGFTNLPGFSIGGKAEPFAKIFIDLEGGSLVGKLSGDTYASATGTWNWIIPAGTNLADGSYTATVNTVDAAGNQTSKPAVLSIVLTSVAPLAPVVIGALRKDGTYNQATNNSGLILEGTANFGDLVSVYVNDGLVGYAFPNPSGLWTLDNSTVLRQDGYYKITTTATNRAGSISPVSAPINIEILTESHPVVQALRVTEGSYPTTNPIAVANNSPTVTGEATPGSLIRLVITPSRGGPLVAEGTVGSNGLFSIPTTGLPQGAIGIVAIAIDRAGNASQSFGPLNLNVDSVAPTLSLANPVSGGKFNSQSWPGSISGAITDANLGTTPASVAIQGPNGLWFDGTAFASQKAVWNAAQGSNSWNLPLAASKLPNGGFTVSVKALDTFGNASTASSTFEYSTVRPVVNSFNVVSWDPRGEFASGGILQLEFSSPVSGLTVGDFVASGATVSNLQGSGNKYTFTITPTGTGHYSVSLPEGSVVDAFGNTNTASQTFARVGSYSDFGVFGSPKDSLGVVTVNGPQGKIRDIVPYGNFFGGVKAVIGDVINPQITDGVTQAVFTAPAQNGGPNIRVFNIATGALLKSFMAFDASYTFGVNIATSDLNQDGYSDLIVGTNGGIRAAVRVFSGKDYSLMPQYSLNPYGSFNGAVQVASGDITRDGKPDIITLAQTGANTDVRIWSGQNGQLINSFITQLPGYTAGVVVASADLNKDGYGEVILGTGNLNKVNTQIFDLLLDKNKPSSRLIQLTDQAFQSFVPNRLKTDPYPGLASSNTGLTNYLRFL